MDIISRETAQELGLKKYFTGEPCVNGHMAERYVKGYFCLGCLGVSHPTEETLAARKQRQEIRDKQNAFNAEIKAKRFELAKRKLELDARKIEIREQSAALKTAAAISHEERRRRKAVLGGMVNCYLLISRTQTNEVREAILSLCQMRESWLQMHDIFFDPNANLGVKWRIRMFPDMVDSIRKMADDLYDAVNRPIVIANRDRHIAEGMAELAKGDGSWPEGDPR